MTYSASKALNRYSISAFYNQDKRIGKYKLLLRKVDIDQVVCRMGLSGYLFHARRGYYLYQALGFLPLY